MNKVVISIMIISLILLSGCSTKNNNRCNEIAKLDYGMKNPDCRWESPSIRDVYSKIGGKWCSCVDYECTNNSCKISSAVVDFKVRR